MKHLHKVKVKGRYSKIIVWAIIILNAAFAAAVLMVFYHTTAEPISLVGAWFAFTTVELWQLSKIKQEKARKDNSAGINNADNLYDKTIIASVIILNVAFTVAVLAVSYCTGAEPIALVGAWFTFTTVQLFQLAKNKREKARKNKGGIDNGDNLH